MRYLILLLITNSLYAQFPSWNWAHNITATPAYPWIVAVSHPDEYGNLIVLSTNISTLKTPGIAKDSGAFVAKFSPDGKLKWCRHIDGYAYSLTTDNKGNIYVAGSYGEGQFGFFAKSKGNVKGILLMKLSPEGKQVWSKNYNSDNSGICEMAVGSSGNIYITGAFTSSLNMDGIMLKDTHSVFIAALNNDGKTLWAHTGSALPQPGPGHMPLMHIMGEKLGIDKDENVCVIFMSEATPCYYICDTYSLVKFDRNGELLQCSLESIWGYPKGIACDNSQNWYVVADRVFTSGSEIYLNKFSKHLDTLCWLTYAGGDEMGVLSFISRPVVDSSGHIYITGWIGPGTDYQRDSIKVGDIWVYRHEGMDAIIARIEPDSGKIVNCYLAGDKNDEWGNDLSIDRYGNLYLTGAFAGKYSEPQDTFCLENNCLMGNSGEDQFFIARLKFSDRKFPEESEPTIDSTKTFEASIYPTPCSELLTVDLTGASDKTIISINDMLGQKVAEVYASGARTIVNTGNLKHGVYLVTIRSESDWLIKKIIIQK
jgi:hypothetical protein